MGIENKYSGRCRGGPVDGQHMVHWRKEKEYFRPVVGYAPDIERAPVEGKRVGSYLWVDGVWFWVKDV